MCTFCRIVAGELPATTVHRDEHTASFLDHRPLFRGHVLLVPLRHVQRLRDLPEDEVAPLFSAARRLEAAVEDGLEAAGSMVLINNVVSQSVPHLHVHVIPRRPKDGLRFWLGPRHPYTTDEPAETYAERIRAALAD